MTAFVTAVFIAVYFGMAAGRIPGLAIDRTGIALAGVVILLVGGAIDVANMPALLEWSTLLLLFALMVLGGHFAAAHCFDFIGAWLSRLQVSAYVLLGITVLVGGMLSVVLVNDIVVFVFTPLLCIALSERGLDPRPFLLALAGSSNAGSAASLIGNPQNILIGELGQLDFFDYFVTAIVPAAAALAAVFVTVAWLWRTTLCTEASRSQAAMPIEIHTWLTAKSLLITVMLIAAMILMDTHREVAALGAAAVLILGRGIATRTLLKEVDWSLLVLISSLFMVTAAFAALPLAPNIIAWLETNELLPYKLALLVPFSAVASNTIGNVPTVVLLVQALDHIPTEVLTALAVFSTLAGNLLLTGSLANIIVAERAHQHGVQLSFGDFAKVGIPETAISIAIATLWFYGMGYLR